MLLQQQLMPALLIYFITSSPLFGTSISIFDDHHAAHLPRNSAICYELEKTLHAKADHIFVTSYIWNTFIKSLNKNRKAKFLKEWDVFDTHIGLLYLKHKKSKNSGIKLHIFTLIAQPFKKQKQSYNKQWVNAFKSLIDIRCWREHHRTTGERSFIYMNGHGSKRSCHYTCETVCGISAAAFSNLLKFFNDELLIDLLGIQSCYWTSKRISELMKKRHGYNTLSFSIITPLRSEKELWLTDYHGQCNSKQSTYYCFYEGIKRMTQCYNGKISREIRSIAKNIDTIKIRNNKRQGITMIMAGSDTLTQI